MQVKSRWKMAVGLFAGAVACTLLAMTSPNGVRELSASEAKSIRGAVCGQSGPCLPANFCTTTTRGDTCTRYSPFTVVCTNPAWLCPINCTVSRLVCPPGILLVEDTTPPCAAAPAPGGCLSGTYLGCYCGTGFGTVACAGTDLIGVTCTGA